MNQFVVLSSLFSRYHVDYWRNYWWKFTNDYFQFVRGSFPTFLVVVWYGFSFFMEITGLLKSKVINDRCGFTTRLEIHSNFKRWVRFPIVWLLDCLIPSFNFFQNQQSSKLSVFLTRVLCELFYSSLISTFFSKWMFNNFAKRLSPKWKYKRPKNITTGTNIISISL